MEGTYVKKRTRGTGDSQQALLLQGQAAQYGGKHIGVQKRQAHMQFRPKELGLVLAVTLSPVLSVLLSTCYVPSTIPAALCEKFL